MTAAVKADRENTISGLEREAKAQTVAINAEVVEIKRKTQPKEIEN